MGVMTTAPAHEQSLPQAPRKRRRTPKLPYLFLVGYAAPRFMLPAYALLALPVGQALHHLATDPRGRVRPVPVISMS